MADSSSEIGAGTWILSKMFEYIGDNIVAKCASLDEQFL